MATDERFVGRNGRLLINKVQAAAKSYDPDLIALLRGDDQARDMFFQEIGDIVVFEGDKFIWTLDAQDYLEGSYTEYSQNIGLTVDGQRISDSDDVVLEFPYKDCVLEFDSTSEDEDRPEVMMNETLMKNEIDYLFAPKVLVNAKLHDEEGEHPLDTVADDENGIIIKGNNLLALHTLLPRYQGKIKLMYWDILYNTDNDQVPYNDSFKHSTWLVMMKNRLEIARQLLRNDGIICIQCDYREDAYLRVLADEIFGRDNLVQQLSVKSSALSGVKTAHKDKTILKTKDTILIYKRGGEIVITPQYEIKDKWDTHYNHYIVKQEDGTYFDQRLRDVLEKEDLIKPGEVITASATANKRFASFCIANADNIYRPVNSIPPDMKKMSKEHPDEVVEYHSPDGALRLALNGQRLSPLSSTVMDINGEPHFAQLLGDLWSDIDFLNTQNEGGVKLPAGKKPEALIKRLIEMFTLPGDIVLDAYLGSGTTAAVSHKLSRYYIGLEQLDKHFALSISRLEHVIAGENGGISKMLKWQGGGSFISCELMKASEQFISRANEAKTDTELVSIFNELLETPFVLYRVDIEKARAGFADLDLEEKREIIIKVIDKNTLYVNYDDIDNSDYDINDTDKAFTRSFYGDDEVK